MITPGVSCLHPVSIEVPNRQYLVRYHVDGKNKSYDHSYYRNPRVVVGCGHCIMCKMKRTREWTLRLIMESKSYENDHVWFITLTYDDAHVPVTYDTDGVPHLTVKKRDHQLFMKRLRKRLDYPVKYFFVGEYGCRTGRPHLHAVIFGLHSEDVGFIEECWPYGFSLSKNFYKETAGYVAGYIQKKLFGKDVYGVSTPPFLACSQHLGEDYFWQNADAICKQGFIVFDGYKYAIPRPFVRKAISEGLLPVVDCEQFELLQNMALDDFYSWVDRNHIEISDYVRNFRLIQQNHYTRQNLTRDLNEVV